MTTVRGAIRNGEVAGSSLVSFDETEAKFQCDCGVIFVRKMASSLSKKANAIQCLSCHMRTKPFAGERYALRRIKSDAVKAGRSFEISLEWFIEKAHEPCHYCGRKDRNTLNEKSKIAGLYNVKGFKYNGLDRKNNDLGYTEENCVPCCLVCNRAKNSMGYNEFIEYLNDLIEFRGTIGDSNVTNDNAVHSARVSDQERQSEAGNDSNIEESQEDSIPVFTFYGDGFYMDSRGKSEWTRGFSGGPYRKVEGTV